MRAFLTCLIFVLVGVACLFHKSSAGLIFAILFFLFAWVSWLARPRKEKDREL